MYNKKLVFAASCLGILMFGIVLTTIGAVLPSLIEKYGIVKTNAGSLMLLLTFGILLGSLIFGPIVDRYGYKNLLIICIVFIFIGLEGIAIAPDLSLLQVAAFLIGLGGGVINGGINALVADISEEGKSANLSILGIFFGIGAVGVPLTLWSLLELFSYQHIIVGIGLIVILPILFFLFIRFPAPKHEQGFPLKDGLGLLKESVLLLFGFILFFESGMEITVGSWSALFFKEILHINAKDAVLYLSFYWFGMMAARLLLGFLLQRVLPVIVQFACFGIGFIGALILLLSHSLVWSTLGLFLIGCGLAAGFPVMLGYVGNLYPKLSGTAFSIALVMALFGGMTFPYVTGAVGQIADLRISFIVIPISITCMAILFMIVLKRIAHGA